MLYKKISLLDYRKCNGLNEGTNGVMFNSHVMGQLRGIFSVNEQYNDQNVYIEVYPGYYDLTITVSPYSNNGDSWCENKLLTAMEFIEKLVIASCKPIDGQLDITIELHT